MERNLNTELKRKCSLCCKNLSLNNFRKYSGERGNKPGIQKYRSICIECEKKQEGINSFKKLFEILYHQYNGKCIKCNLDISNLPALQFHHLDPNIKEIPWSRLKKHRIEKIIKKLREEKVILMCSNDHLLEHAIFFKKHKNLILKEDLFNLSNKEIKDIIDQYFEKINYNTSESRSKDKYHLKLWLKKRFVIESLFNSKCIGCGNITIQSNLPALIFHHRDDKKKKHKFENIITKPINKIIEIIINEDMICLCSNCHSLLHEKYFTENVNKIFTENLNHIIIKAIKRTKDVINNVKNFSINPNFKIRDPFKQNISIGEIWKKYLKSIYQLCLIKGSDKFTNQELSKFMNISREAVIQILPKLLEKNLIEIVDYGKIIKQGNLIYGQTPYNYRINEKGIELAKKK